MKLFKYFFKAFILAPLFTFAQNDVCPPNGINTDPDNSTNPSAPNPLFINEMSWFSQAVNNEFFDIPIYDFSAYYPISSMLNPYSEDNELSAYLSNSDLVQLDILPEDGWELLFINLGYYPDLTQLSTLNESIGHPNIPYIILYNKHRSILRIFANIKFTGFQYEQVEVKLSHSESYNSSGLFRLNNGNDLGLDQATITNDISSYAQLPENPDEWFHVDFQVSYDPCICLYDSRIFLELRPIGSTSIEISNNDWQINSTVELENGIGLNQENAIIPVSPKMITFHTMTENAEFARAMTDKYLNRMMTENYDSEWLELQYSTLATLEALSYAGQNTISLADIDDAGMYSAQLRYQWGFIPFSDIVSYKNEFVDDVEASWSLLPSDCWSYSQIDFAFTVDLPKLVRYIQERYPTISDVLKTSIFTTETSQRFSQLPSGSYKETSVNLSNFASGTFEQIELLTPGTYPIQENDPNFGSPSAQAYPVYNEALGLFAVLNHPQVETHAYFEEVEGPPYINYTAVNEPCFIGNENQSNPIGFAQVWDRYTYSEHFHHFQFKLKQPLAIVFNPAANIDVANVKISASLRIKGDININWAGPQYYQENTLAVVPPADLVDGYFFCADPLLDDFHYAISEDNLFNNELAIEGSGFEVLDGFSYIPLSSENSAFSYSSPTVPLDAFNDMVCTVTAKSVQKWRDNIRFNSSGSGLVDRFLCEGTYPQESVDNWIDYLQEASDAKVNASKFEVVVYLEIPFNSIGDKVETAYHQVTFEVFGNDAVTTPNILPVNWSYTQNPNDYGTASLANYGYFGVRNWTENDMETYGGTYMTLPSSDPVVIPSALYFIDITGNQTKTIPIDEVIFKAQDHISVYGDLTILEGFTLRLEDLVNETSIPTPPVSVSTLSAFCDAQGPNAYQANQRSAPQIFETEALNRINSNVSIFEIYPNPGTDVLNVSFNNSQNATNFSIYNTLGMNMYSIPLNSQNISRPAIAKVDISTLSEGTYILVVNLEDGARLSKSFIVVK